MDKWRYPKSWIVYFMENPTLMDGLGIYLFQETTMSGDMWRYAGYELI